MPRVGLQDALGFASVALTIILLVLDKAGKLKGPTLLILLALAAALMLPVAIGNSWVADAGSGMLKFSRGLLLVLGVGVGYALLAIWISTQETPSSGGLSPPESIEQPPQPIVVVRVDVAKLRTLHIELSTLKADETGRSPSFANI